MWKRMKEILINIGNKEILDETEREIYNTYKNLVKQEYWEEVKTRIIKK